MGGLRVDRSIEPGFALFPSEIICASLAAGTLPGNDAGSYKTIWTPVHCATAWAVLY